MESPLPERTLRGWAVAPALSSSSFHAGERIGPQVRLILLLCFPDSEPLAAYCPEQALCICVKIRHVRTFALAPMVFLFYSQIRVLSFLRRSASSSRHPPSPVFLSLPVCSPPPRPSLLPAEQLFLPSLRSSAVCHLSPPPRPQPCLAPRFYSRRGSQKRRGALLTSFQKYSSKFLERRSAGEAVGEGPERWMGSHCGLLGRPRPECQGQPWVTLAGPCSCGNHLLLPGRGGAQTPDANSCLLRLWRRAVHGTLSIPAVLRNAGTCLHAA